jgi:hypothetical protein
MPMTLAQVLPVQTPLLVLVLVLVLVLALALA